jgi:uncharacterized protein YegP (UPF0339 family)
MKFKIYRDANGRIVADSAEGYDSRAGCARAIRSIVDAVKGLP